jgi:hypothetical protein
MTCAAVARLVKFWFFFTRMKSNVLDSASSFFTFQLTSRIVQILTGHLTAWRVYVVVLTNYVVDLTVAYYYYYYYYYYYPFPFLMFPPNVTLGKSLQYPLRLDIVGESWWVPASCQLMKTSPIKEVVAFFGPFRIFFWLQASDLDQSVKTSVRKVFEVFKVICLRF